MASGNAFAAAAAADLANAQPASQLASSLGQFRWLRQKVSPQIMPKTVESRRNNYINACRTRLDLSSS